MARSSCRAAAVVAATAAGLLAAGAAHADRERIRLTAAGRAAARAAVLKRADLGTAAGWAGGAEKADLSSTPPCAGFRPKQSDLVLIGAARTVWKNAGVEFDSEAQVLEKPAMVRLDWQRTVLAPQVLPCMRSALAKEVAGSARLVSLRQIAAPRLATFTRRYRAVLEVKAGRGRIGVMVDVLLVGRGRTELTLTTTAPLAAARAVAAAELRLGRVLASRAGPLTA